MENLEIKMNRYIVKMFQHGRDDMCRSMKVIARSEFEAIDKVRDNEWWYNEGKGHDYEPIKWPVTFKAELWNQ